MKSKSILLAAVVVCLMTCLSSCGEKPVAPAELPEAIQTFVQQTFPGQTITLAQKDRELFGTEYEVVLANGTQVTFGSDNVWEKINCQTQPVPATVVPQAIASNVQTNFPETMIVKIDKESYGYDVELNNGVELKFDKQGVFTSMEN